MKPSPTCLQIILFLSLFDLSQRMTPKTSKHVTISGVIAKSRKSIVLQDEKTGKILGAGTSDVVGLVSKEAACVVVKKDFPPSSQPQKSLSKDAIKPHTPSARESLLETDEATKLGHPIAAKEPGVTSITSQAPHKNTGLEQCSVPGLENREASKKTLPATKIAEKPRNMATIPLQSQKKPPSMKLLQPKLVPQSPQSRKAPRKT